ncbi:acylphosphatase [Candidatus Woesearchaeota archaeon]|nr:acylphosphatase [Candidatus Woesearchaeota archaeon]
MLTWRILIKGKVQGVCFRDFVKQNANKLGIYGYVHNLRNGCVEVIASGKKSDLDKLKRLCQMGPLMAKVDDLVWEKLPDEKFDYFDVRR